VASLLDGTKWEVTWVDLEGMSLGVLVAVAAEHAADGLVKEVEIGIKEEGVVIGIKEEVVIGIKVGAVIGIKVGVVVGIKAEEEVIGIKAEVVIGIKVEEEEIKVLVVIVDLIKDTVEVSIRINFLAVILEEAAVMDLVIVETWEEEILAVVEQTLEVVSLHQVNQYKLKAKEVHVMVLTKMAL